MNNTSSVISSSAAHFLSCPVCRLPSVREGASSEAVLWRCPVCDHCFSDAASISTPEKYTSEYFEVIHRNWFANPDYGLFDMISRFITVNNPDASLLDVGCGNGNFLRYLNKKHPGMSLTGIDIAVNDSVEGIAFIQGDALATDFGRTFDIVMGIAVIEHVPDIHLFMERLCSFCAPGGFIILTTVNDRSILYGAARFLQKLGFSGPCDRLYSRHHLNHFNVRSLGRLCSCHGLHAIKVMRHNAPLAAIDFTAASPLTAAIFRIGVWMAFTLGSLTGRSYQQTVICRKSD